MSWLFADFGLAGAQAGAVEHLGDRFGGAIALDRSRLQLILGVPPPAPDDTDTENPQDSAPARCATQMAV